MTQHKTQAVNEMALFFDQYNYNDRFEVETTENSITITRQTAKQRVPHPKTKGFE